MDWSSVYLRGTDESYVVAGAAAQVMDQVLEAVQGRNPWIALQVPVLHGERDELVVGFFDAREVAAILPTGGRARDHLDAAFG